MHRRWHSANDDTCMVAKTAADRQLPATFDQPHRRPTDITGRAGGRSPDELEELDELDEQDEQDEQDELDELRTPPGQAADTL